MSIRIRISLKYNRVAPCVHVEYEYPDVCDWLLSVSCASEHFIETFIRYAMWLDCLMHGMSQVDMSVLLLEETGSRFPLLPRIYPMKLNKNVACDDLFVTW